MWLICAAVNAAAKLERAAPSGGWLRLKLEFCYNYGMSLTSDDLADIKQLMQGLLSQQAAQLDARFDAMDKKIEEVAEKIEEIDKHLADNADTQNEILNAVGSDLNRHSAKLDDHEERLNTLERKAA